jgi:hypothetical protein
MSRKFTILFLTATFLVALATLALTANGAFAENTNKVQFGNGPYKPPPPPKPAVAKGGGDPTKGLNLDRPKPSLPPPKP